VCTHLITVVAHNLGDGHLPDLRQLRLREPDERVAVLVPEAVALAQVPELGGQVMVTVYSNFEHISARVAGYFCTIRQNGEKWQ
jgi:hypothetical protein